MMEEKMTISAQERVDESVLRAGAKRADGQERPLRRIRLTVAYDGTNYNGWQLQPNGITIEEVLNKAISSLTGEEIAVIGASRTDSGVHARCNCAVFDTRMRMPAEKFSYALNQRLPEDVRIRKSEEAAPDWHPRKCDSIKTYEYRILNEEFPDPLNRLYAHFTYLKLDVDKMQDAAQYLVGEHDFKSFCSANTQAESTVRRITALNVTRQGNLITIRVSGTGFLYNMVRIIAGTLMDVGNGKYEPEKCRKSCVHVTEMQPVLQRLQEGSHLRNMNFSDSPQRPAKPVFTGNFADKK